MARLGVSFTEVAKAASHLVGQGKNPTIEQVRLILGTGSSTTIANHLRQWKQNQAGTHFIAAKENIPQELIAIMQGLWSRVIDQSQEKVSNIENDFEQSVQLLQQELQKYKTNNRRWQRLFNRWVSEREELIKHREILIQEKAMLQEENAVFKIKCGSLCDQLKVAQHSLDEFRAIYAKTQINMEHMQENYATEYQTFKTERKQSEQQIAGLQKELDQYRKTHIELQHAYKTVNENYMQLQTKNEDLQLTLLQVQQAKNEYLHGCEQWKNQYQATENTLQDKLNKLIEAKTEIKFLTEKLKHAKLELDEMTRTNAILKKEKEKIANAKSVLQEKLDQLEKIVTV